MTLSALQGALEALYGLERRKDKLGLDGTRALLGALDHPERRFRAVHVAGTNGKGSVCALIERVLRAAGVRTGLFTSPHLVDFRERIRVDGRWADETWLFETLRHVAGLPAGRDRTFFEIATALGFGYFAARDVEWAVVEVGLGGRLDTTNVLIPEIAVITSIGRDHTEILGDTVELIAAEKAGIAKTDVPLVIGAGMDPRACGVLRDAASGVGAPLIEVSDAGWEDAGFDAWLAGFDSPWGPLVPAPRTVAGFGPGNTATALTVLARLHRTVLPIPREALVGGLAAARWPGRFESCPTRPRLWWDGAHNPHGAEGLERSWRRADLPPPAALVVALSRDKDPDGMLAPLARLAGPGTPLFATRTRNERALEPERIVAAAAAAGLSPRHAASVPEACEAALARAVSGDRPVLLAGSLFAVGEAMAAFGGAPGEWL
ncbi:MAG: bifunctional folylpolyglutamate synthase/dihydrofolate synthase [Candidatus Eisenbacteria bacterium]